MKNLCLIAALGKNNEIGAHNKLIWHLPSDLAFFKEKTLNKTIVMGRCTYESLPKKLPNRNYIVLSNHSIEEVLTISNKEKLLKEIEKIEEDVYIIGGQSIYSLFIDEVEVMYLTHIDACFEADKFFPNFDKNLFDQQLLIENVENNLKYQTIKYIRRDKK